MLMMLAHKNELHALQTIHMNAHTVTQPAIKELKFPRVVVVNLCILLGSLCVSLILFPISNIYPYTRTNSLRISTCTYIHTVTQPSIKELKFPRLVVANLCVTLILFPVSIYPYTRTNRLPTYSPTYTQ